MNRTSTFLLLLFVLTCGIESCQPDFTDESNAVESMLGVLNKVEKTAGSIDTRLIQQYIKSVNAKCTRIQSELTDTIQIEVAQKLVRFCDLQKHLQSCLDRKGMIDAEVVRTRNQLFNLKTDLKSKAADRDSVNNYIEAEFLFTESLSEGTDQIVVELNSCFETYAELKDDIDRLLVNLPEKSSE